ncbi:2-hydroxyhepta-2,4-diene-1,7-dioate isomerase [Lujinxingia litoralis]|uniref:2-hydroxyhepta-2,4-diene-1,7-dioate isomerase n=1 Tax=Lujinxingia litoralis TaxID=2211119 RepID=A0A328C3C9_9DELT|nr:fumarylacetoacetate hydrolase family protein [Lujinxingia litoralis]RAL20763.1 2-hydroxyhepta-2,4-diene-1,7-dioate isomerase [Lujinxingia litoralis]
MSRNDRFTRLVRIAHPAGRRPVYARCEGDLFITLAGDVADLHQAIRQGRPLPEDGARIRKDRAQLLAPACPSKVICVGLNYRAHAEEMGKPLPPEPLIFLKPSTAVIGPDEAIELPPDAHEVHHEGELAMIVGERIKDVREDQAMDAIFGYTCACDVTARDIQRRESRYTRAKGFDTFAPLGPALALTATFNPAEHTLRCWVDGELRQQTRLNDFIFELPRVVAFISSIMTLLPGDVILTGTPAGVGPITEGQRVEVAIDGIGTLHNPVRRRP